MLPRSRSPRLPCQISPALQGDIGPSPLAPARDAPRVCGSWHSSLSSFEPLARCFAQRAMLTTIMM
eukprot:6361782-Pyramimonas_sp.AAC.1